VGENGRLTFSDVFMFVIDPVCKHTKRAEKEIKLDPTPMGLENCYCKCVRVYVFVFVFVFACACVRVRVRVRMCVSVC